MTALDNKVIFKDMNDYKTFPSGDARYRSRSASLWSVAYSANATSTDWRNRYV